MVYCFNDYMLDPAGRELRHAGRRIALEPKVLQVLLYLLEHRDRVVSKTELFAQCWPDTFVSESALNRCLARLRKALQTTPAAPPVIKTLHRQGYRFVAAVTFLGQSMPPATVDMARLHVPPVLQAALSPVPPRPQDTPAPLTAPAGMSPVAPAVRRATPGAERRQLTVLFCDVVGSTALASQPPSYGTL